MTANITIPGRLLADKLNRYIGTTSEILKVCSLITRHAKTYARFQEAACNREMTSWEVRREAQVEARIVALVESLPHTGEGPIAIKLQGDPRGFTVKLVLPPCYRAYDTWGGVEDGFGVPNS